MAKGTEMSKKKSIIKSLLDTDLYKLSMAFAVWMLFPDVRVKYKFKCRNKGIDFSPFLGRINNAIDALCKLQFKPKELDYLLDIESSNGVQIFSQRFIDYLRHFKLNRKNIKVHLDKMGELQIEIEGSWLNTILFETPVLAIVNEIYFSQYGEMSELECQRKVGDHYEDIWDAGIEGNKRLEEKMELLETVPDFYFSDFGTRRRYSFDWQEYVLKRLFKTGCLNGTSNVYFAMQMGIQPIGTMAHEWLQVGQALGPLRQSVTYMLVAWLKAHGGNLAIALTDVISSRTFFDDLSLVHTKVFDGVRHDSGDPVDYGYMAIDHYKKFNIDPMSKAVVFSDGLTIASAIGLHKEFLGKIKTGFGIGTSITNDVGHPALNIVLKVIEVNGQPVAKISDSPGKGMCEDPEYVRTLKRIYGLPVVLSVKETAILLGSEPPVECSLVEATERFRRRHDKKEEELIDGHKSPRTGRSFIS